MSVKTIFGFTILALFLMVSLSGAQAASREDDYIPLGASPAVSHPQPGENPEAASSDTPGPSFAPKGPITIFYDDFEGANRWTSSGLWHRVVNGTDCPTMYDSPVTSWYYGTNAAGACEYTGPTNGLLISPVITGITSNTVLRFRMRRGIWSIADHTYVAISTNATGTPRTNLPAVLPTDFVNWNSSDDVSLGAYAGQSIYIVFDFNATSTAGGKFGWMIDDVEVARPFSCDGATVLTCNAAPKIFPTGPINEATKYSCSPNTYNGNEAKFTFTLTTQQHVTIRMTPALPTQNLDAFLLQPCDLTKCLAGGTDTITRPFTNAGTYFVIVDGLTAADNGNFTLELICEDISDGNIGCGGHITNTTANGNAFLNNYSCAAGVDFAGNELVYLFTNPIAQNVYAYVNSPNLDVILSSSADVKTCYSWAGDILAWYNAPAQSYYIIVDGPAGETSEPFDLTVTCGKTLNCSARVKGDINCPGVFAGTTVGGTNNTVLYKCTGQTQYWGPEVVYRFINTVQQGVSLRLTQGSGALDIFVFDAQCDEGNCLSQGAAGFCLPNLAPGQYYVVLDGEDPAGADYELTVECLPPDSWNRWSVCEDPRPPGTTNATTAATEWNFDDRDYCYTNPGHRNYLNQCDFAMYAVADCGDYFHIPLYDVETGYIKIYNMLGGYYETLYAESYDPITNPPTPTGWVAGPADYIEWQDCSGMDPKWNNKVEDIHFYGDPTVCGIFRLEFYHWGGFVWDLFANCLQGKNARMFDIYDTFCAAYAAYNPQPELVIDNLLVTGICPNFQVEFDVTNIGCVVTGAQIHVESDLGGFFDIPISTLEPGVPRHTTSPLTVTGSGVGTVTAYSDFSNVVRECSEFASGNISACIPANNRKQATFSINCVTCPNPPVVALGGELYTCQSESIKIGVNLVITQGTQPYTYHWEPAADLDDASSPNPTVINPITTTVYTCQVTDSEGCVGNSFVKVNVRSTDPAPVVKGPLKLKKAGNDVELFWDADEGWTLNVRRTECTTFPSPQCSQSKQFIGSAKIDSGLFTGHSIDAGAVFPPPPLYYYRVSASNCRGIEGQF